MYGRIWSAEKVKPVRAAETVTTMTLWERHMTKAAAGKNTTLARYTVRVPNCFTSRSMIVEKKMDVTHCRNRPKLPMRTPAGKQRW